MQVNQEALAKMLTEFSKQIQTSTNNELNQITDNLQVLSVSLKNLVNNFDKISLDFGMRIDNSGEKLQHSFTEISENLLIRFQEITAQMQMTSNNMNIVSTPLLNTVNNLDNILSQVQNLVNNLNSTSQVLATSNDNSINALQETSQTIEQVWKKYQQHFEKIDEDVAGSFQNLSTGLLKYQGQVENFITQLDNSLDTSLKSLSNIIVELVEAVEDFQSHK
jgi:ElaB/YqjD/DUF883 family membrane-anchored ribosome-binding protein